VGVLGGTATYLSSFFLSKLEGWRLQTHVVTAGYDRCIRLLDVRTGAVVKTFTGHRASVSSVVFNLYGNLIISGYAATP